MEMEQRICASNRKKLKSEVNPTTLFHYLLGQMVLRRHRTFSKIHPKTSLPYRIRRVSGAFRQRITLEPIESDKDKGKQRR